MSSSIRMESCFLHQNRFRMHCSGPHMTPIHRLMLFFKSCKHVKCLLHIFEQTNSLQLTKRLLMHMVSSIGLPYRDWRLQRMICVRGLKNRREEIPFCKPAWSEGSKRCMNVMWLLNMMWQDCWNSCKLREIYELLWKLD